MTSDETLGLIAIPIGAIVYLLPTIIAFARKGVRHRWVIAVIDLLLGWTLIGWIGALIWAIWPKDPPKPSFATPTELERSLSVVLDSERSQQNIGGPAEAIHARASPHAQTVREFLTSDALDQSLGETGAAYYRDRFLKVARKSGISESAIITPKLADKVLGRGSWNWRGLLFSNYWWAGRNIPFAWALNIWCMALIIAYAALPSWRSIIIAMSAGIGIMSFRSGNTYLLWSILRAAQRGEVSSHRLSWWRVAFALLIVFSAAAVAGAIDGDFGG